MQKYSYIEDASEMKIVKAGGDLMSLVMTDVVMPKLLEIVDSNHKVTHSTLTAYTEKEIMDRLEQENLVLCYPPVFQSGGKFDLKPTASSNDEDLYIKSSSVIICGIGLRYNNYCLNVARTFFVASNSAQNKAYEVLLKAHAAAISELMPDNVIGAPYQAAVAVVEKEAPDLLPFLTESAGTSIGTEFQESALCLNAKNERLLQAGMVFNVSLGFQNLRAHTKDPKTNSFSLLLSDTVVVSSGGRRVLTSACTKAWNDVRFSEDKDEEEEEEEEEEEQPTGRESCVSKAHLRSENQEMSKETARRLAGGGSGTRDGGHGSVQDTSDFIAYKNVNSVPFSKELVIQVDQRNEVVLVPIYGSMVPFHISTVQSVTDYEDSQNCRICIKFNVSVTGAGTANPGSIYLKKITFRTKDSIHSADIVQQIRILRRKFTSRELERAERATLVTQEKLQLANKKMKPPSLSGLWIRPVFGKGRKLTGTLEAHVNGFRYSTSPAKERVDIMYGNIKHAFFQPAEREMITLLHFHLHNHIMVGSKKTKDVQFYVKVVDAVRSLCVGRRSATTDDENEEEEQERERKRHIKKDFEAFVERVHAIWEGQPQCEGLKIDQPLREYGFHGVAHKGSRFLLPTEKCLVEFIENPFVVITVNEIEIVHLERVGQKTFDLTVVFKDFKEDVFSIDHIPWTSLDGVKWLLDTADIKYYLSRFKLNLSWGSVLQGISDDPEKFIEDGGWEFLKMESSDSDSVDQDSDQDYEPSDVPESDSS